MLAGQRGGREGALLRMSDSGSGNANSDGGKNIAWHGIWRGTSVEQKSDWGCKWTRGTKSTLDPRSQKDREYRGWGFGLAVFLSCAAETRNVTRQSPASFSLV